ncbi:hypothetical protein GJ496_009822 [Pomphorhynchus laevis]|nr:hypothetical protein GJ496_009822 [Pomphorhynchus laevis]
MQSEPSKVTISNVNFHNFQGENMVSFDSSTTITSTTKSAKHLSNTYGNRAEDVMKLCKPSGKRWPLAGRQLHALLPYLDGENKTKMSTTSKPSHIDGFKQYTLMSSDLIRVMLCNNLYNEDKIKTWFQNFLWDCPDGKVNKDKLLTVFKHFYNETKASQLVENTLNAIGISQQNDDGTTSFYLDFSRYVLTINLICQSNVEDKLHIATGLYIFNRTKLENKQSDEFTIEMIRRGDACRLLESIAILLGVKRFQPNKVAFLDNIDNPTKSPYKEKVDKLFDNIGKEEFSQNEFVREFSKDPFVKGLLQTRF